MRKREKACVIRYLSLNNRVPSPRSGSKMERGLLPIPPHSTGPRETRQSTKLSKGTGTSTIATKEQGHHWELATIELERRDASRRHIQNSIRTQQPTVRFHHSVILVASTTIIWNQNISRTQGICCTCVIKSTQTITLIKQRKLEFTIRA